MHLLSSILPTHPHLSYRFPIERRPKGRDLGGRCVQHDPANRYVSAPCFQAASEYFNLGPRAHVLCVSGRVPGEVPPSRLLLVLPVAGHHGLVALFEVVGRGGDLRAGEPLGLENWIGNRLGAPAVAWVEVAE